MNDCQQYRDLISRLVDGELSGEEKAQLAEHLRSCEDCAALYEIFSALSRTIGEDLEEPPEELCVNVMAKLRREQIWKKNYVPLKKLIAAAACVAVILLAAGGILPKILESSASTVITGDDLEGVGNADQSGYQSQYGTAGESEDSPLIRSDSVSADTGKASKENTSPVTTHNGSTTGPYSTASGAVTPAPVPTVAPTQRPVATPKPTVTPTQRPVATPAPTDSPTQGLIITRPSAVSTQKPVATSKPAAAPAEEPVVSTAPTSSATLQSAGSPKAEASTAPAATAKPAASSAPAPSAAPSLAKAPSALQKTPDAADEAKANSKAEDSEIVTPFALDDETVADETPLGEGETTPELFTVSLLGSCQLAAPEKLQSDENGLPLTIGEDMSYPFANTVDHFSHDELTLAVLECALTDGDTAENTAPASYGEMLVQGGVDFVSTIDKFDPQADDEQDEATGEVLEKAGIIPAAQGQSQIVTTANNLKIGIYTAGQTDKAAAEAAIEQLQKDGAEYIICMLRWSAEDSYSPSDSQSALAHDCITAGADLVFGSGSQHLLPVEEFSGGLIVYDLGSWISGDSSEPADPDTAVIQLSISRDANGIVSLDSYQLIPCCQSSDLDGAAAAEEGFNDYRPSPYKEKSAEFERVMSKLDGKFEVPTETAKP